MEGEQKIDVLEEAIILGKLLSQSAMQWAFAGGIAVGIHGYVRATEDIDIVLNFGDLNELDILLGDMGYIINDESIDFKDGFKLFRRVKIVGEEYLVLDVIIPPEEFGHIMENRIEGLIDKAKIYVISKKDLLRMKKSSGRMKDLIDIEELEKIDG